MTVHFTLNWVMGGGAIGVALGFILGFFAVGLMDTSGWSGTLGAAGTGLIVAGAAAFFIGIGMAL